MLWELGEGMLRKCTWLVKAEKKKTIFNHLWRVLTGSGRSKSGIWEWLPSSEPLRFRNASFSRKYQRALHTQNIPFKITREPLIKNTVMEEEQIQAYQKNEHQN